MHDYPILNYSPEAGNGTEDYFVLMPNGKVSQLFSSYAEADIFVRRCQGNRD